MYLKSKLSKRLKSGIILLSLIFSTSMTSVIGLALGDSKLELYSNYEIIDAGPTGDDVQDNSCELKDDEDIGDLIIKYFVDIINVPTYILEYMASTPRADDHVNDVEHGA